MMILVVNPWEEAEITLDHQSSLATIQADEDIQLFA